MGVQITMFPLNDTDYTAEAMAAFCATHTRGVKSADDNFKVSFVSGMSVKVSKGLGWLSIDEQKGHVIFEPKDLIFTVPAASTADRFDAVAATYSAGTNQCEIDIITGTPGAGPPTPRHDADTGGHEEIFFAYIYVPANATSLSSSSITDKRLDESVCGLMRDAIPKIPTDDLLKNAADKFDALYKEMESLVTSNQAGKLLGTIKSTIPSSYTFKASVSKTIANSSSNFADNMFELDSSYVPGSNVPQMTIDSQGYAVFDRDCKLRISGQAYITKTANTSNSNIQVAIQYKQSGPRYTSYSESNFTQATDYGRDMTFVLSPKVVDYTAGDGVKLLVFNKTNGSITVSGGANEKATYFTIEVLPDLTNIPDAMFVDGATAYLEDKVVTGSRITNRYITIPDLKFITDLQGSVVPVVATEDAPDSDSTIINVNKMSMFIGFYEPSTGKYSLKSNTNGKTWAKKGHVYYLYFIHSELYSYFESEFPNNNGEWPEAIVLNPMNVNPSSGGTSGVTSSNGRTGTVTPQSGDYTASQGGAVPTTRKINSKTLEADITLTYSDVMAVPITLRVNNKPHVSDLTLDSTDVGAIPATEKGVPNGVATLDSSGNLVQSGGGTAGVTSFQGRSEAVTPQSGDYTSAQVGVVPDTRNINGKTINTDINLLPSDIGSVPTDRKINGKSINTDITLSASDVGAVDSSQLSGYVPTARTVNGKSLANNINLTASDVGADSAGLAAAVQTDLNSHESDTDVHVTAAEKAQYNAKLDASKVLITTDTYTDGDTTSLSDGTLIFTYEVTP